MSEPIAFEELDLMAEVIRVDGTGSNGRWAAYAGRVLELPAWFDMKLDPAGTPYREQQFRLWQAISGVQTSYDPLRDEQTPEVEGFDAVRAPGFYTRRDAAAVTSAADHLIALGNLIKLSGLRPGDTAIEYGAGFGQIAVTLARLGVTVYAVDINRMFNEVVRKQADHYGVPLRAVHGGFGDNPLGDAQYDAVLFYEAFHHCQDALSLIAKLRSLVKPNGAVLMAGEPIVAPSDVLPYPWGMRLDAETVAVVRWRHWFELGFQEDFLVRAFIANGFLWTKHPCALTFYGEVHAFRHRPSRIEMAGYILPPGLTAGWSAPEPTGRWTTGAATLPIDAGGQHTHIRVCLCNHHAQATVCRLTCGPVSTPINLGPLEQLVVTLPCARGTAAVEIAAELIVASVPGDGRMLGVFVQWFEYVRAVEPAGAAPPSSEPGRVEVTKYMALSGRTVAITGEPSDPYFANAAAHATDMADLTRRVSALPDGAVILDVGANLGLSAIAMAIAQPLARVFAFEPNPATCQYLRRNAAPFSNIEVVQAAVSDRETVLHFHPSPYAAGSHVVGVGHAAASMPTIEVRALALDRFVEERGIEPCLIKIDVEGHEPEALDGAAKLIGRFSPAIYMEFNSWTLNAFAGHSPAAFAQAIWGSFDVEGYPEPLAFLHENLVQHGCVSNIAMRLKPGASVPSLAVMSFPQAARDQITGS